MAFTSEPIAYEKTALADLQGAWITSRATVVSAFGFPDADKPLFYIDEAMSRESVRNLDAMKVTLVLIRHLAIQARAPSEVLDGIDEVQDCFDEAVAAIADGSAA